MLKTDNPNYLLYIEPSLKEKTDKPCLDEWVELLILALRTAKTGCAIEKIGQKVMFDENIRYRGVYKTECGESSKTYEYFLENGIITNTLCKYYMIWYRNSIPDSEWIKLRKTAEYFKFKID